MNWFGPNCVKRCNWTIKTSEAQVSLTSDVASFRDLHTGQNHWLSPSIEQGWKTSFMAAFNVLLVGTRRMVHLSSNSADTRHASQVFSIDEDIVKRLLTVEPVSKMLSNMYVKTSGESLARLAINVEPLALET